MFVCLIHHLPSLLVQLSVSVFKMYRHLFTLLVTSLCTCIIIEVVVNCVFLIKSFWNVLFSRIRNVPLMLYSPPLSLVRFQVDNWNKLKNTCSKEIGTKKKVLYTSLIVYSSNHSFYCPLAVLPKIDAIAFGNSSKFTIFLYLCTYVYPLRVYPMGLVSE